MVKETFKQLLQKYTESDSKITELWNDVEANYSTPKRHYHTLQHLEHLLLQISNVKEDIADLDCVLFSVFYHDIIYNPLKTTNEEKSADFAENRMRSIAVPEKMIDSCRRQIMATKKHEISEDKDTNYFTDADLSVLGLNWNEYELYYQQVRKEYSLYPALIYNPGRKKVLQHFLSMERIFKTDFFNTHFEEQAKKNLQKELAIYV